MDIAGSGNTAITADVTFGRAVPIINISNPLNPSSVGFWSLQSPGYGSSIAVDLSFGYLIIPGTLQVLKYQNIVDTLGIPPTISITSPVSGTPLIQGQTITFSANATDDVAVSSVNFLVNGLVISTTSSQPYQLSYTVPLNATSLVFGATAVDFGNNVGAAANVTLAVIPDPLTTAKGRVVDSSGDPVAGATVSVFKQSAISAADGTFSFSGLPTIQGPIAVTARTIINGNSLGGISSALQPILGGVTNVGDIRILPIPFITSINPKSALAGPVVNITVTGINLTGSTFAFAGSGSSQITVSSASINPAGTSANLTLAVNSNAAGRFTLVGTNVAGRGDSTPTVGFLPGNSPFNTISIPGSDPNGDPDFDGLTNAKEIALGTDPLNMDTDGDGWPDALEVSLGSNPLDPKSVPNPAKGSGYLTSPILSILNNANPSIVATGSKQYVSSLRFSILNNLNPSIGTVGLKQYVSSLTFSILNNLNPSVGMTGSKQYVSSPAFSMLNALNPSVGMTGSKQYVSSPTFSVLNALNPSIGGVGTKQYVSSLTFSILNGISPAPMTPSQRFVNSLVFSMSNLASASHSGILLTLVHKGAVAARVARPWLFQEDALGGPGALDSDHDGISDEDEIRMGTNPYDADTDHDGYPDGLEIALGSDPLDPNSIPDIKRPGFVISPDVLIRNYILQAMKIVPVQPAELRRDK
ncbi:MAG: Ig-like domain-containing protein [Bryobacteraceae bacterium]